jgi:polar amino acid transport system substrate-binding protein
MRGWGLLLLLGSMAFSVARAADSPLPEQVRLVSEEWEDYTRADGSGLAWDVMRKIFEPAGVAVVTRIEPYLRSVGLVQKGEADAWVGSYQQEAEALYPRWRYDTDHIYALALASKPVPAYSTVGNYRLAWVRGYEFQHYLPGIRRYNEVQRRTGILSMLEHDRADYYIDALTEIDVILKQTAEPARYRRTHLAELPLYLGFADTPRGRALRALYDKRMDELVPGGQLREIYQHWQQPYPFDAPVGAQQSN